MVLRVLRYFSSLPKTGLSSETVLLCRKVNIYQTVTLCSNDGVAEKSQEARMHFCVVVGLSLLFPVVMLVTSFCNIFARVVLFVDQHSSRCDWLFSLLLNYLISREPVDCVCNLASNMNTTSTLLGNDAIQAGIKAGNINTVGSTATYSMDLSAESQEAQVQHADTLRRYEAQQRARSIIVPTAVEDVQQKLRELGHVVTFFGENHADRRERLREVIARLELDEEESAEMQVDRCPHQRHYVVQIKACISV